MKTDYFEQMYTDNPDPWGFESRWYEQRKYASTLAALTRPHYGSVFEPGCSIGVLSALLARRCDRLLAVDLVELAVEQTRRRLDDLREVDAEIDVRQWDAHDEWPDDVFDLVVVSEMLYYLEADDAADFMRRAADHLSPRGEIVLVHWRPRVPEYPLTGDEAHQIACTTAGLTRVGHYDDDDFVLDVLSPLGVDSVADREGLRD